MIQYNLVYTKLYGKVMSKSVSISMADVVSKVLEKRKEQEDFTITLNGKIKYHEIDTEILTDFIEARKKYSVYSLEDYVHQRFYKDNKDIQVIPRFGSTTIENLDLSNIDFSGCDFGSVTFQHVTLNGSSFADSDLSNVLFNGCSLQNTDFRGADLSKVKFGMDKKTIEEDCKGMLLSMHKDLFEPYLLHNGSLIDKEKARFEDNQKKLIAEKESEITAVNKELGISNKYITKLVVSLTSAADATNPDFNKLVQKKEQLEEELAILKRTNYHKDNTPYIISPNFEILKDAAKKKIIKFDHGYVRGSSKEERAQKKQYVKMNRWDAQSYLEALKKEPGLSMNEFAKRSLKENGQEEIEGAKIIADFSSINPPENLSGLDFTGADLQEVCFSGARMNGCNFTNANISKAIFESAELVDTTFNNTDAFGTNFFYSNLSGAQIRNCDFRTAFMRGSYGVGTKAESSDLSGASIRNGIWDDASLSHLTMHDTSLEKVSLKRAIIKNVDMRRSVMYEAILSDAEILNTDLRSTIMAEVDASRTKFKNSLLTGTYAPKINFYKAEFDQWCKLDEADFREAIMSKLKAEKVKFTESNLARAKLVGAELQGADLEYVQAQFAQLTSAELRYCKAQGINLSGAQLNHVNAKGADLSQAIVRYMAASKADFSKSVLSDIDASWTNFQEAVMKECLLRRADLRGTNLRDTNLQGASLGGSKIDKATDFAGARAEGATGTLHDTEPIGDSREISVNAKTEEDNNHDRARRLGPIAKMFSKIATPFANGCKKVAAFVKRPFASKRATRWGRIIGAVVGATLVTGTVASIVFSAGLSLVAAGAITGVCVLVSGGIGAMIGDYAARKLDIVDVGVGTAAFLAGGPTTAVITMALSRATNLGSVVSELVTTVSENAEEFSRQPEFLPSTQGLIKEVDHLKRVHQPTEIPIESYDTEARITQARRGQVEAAKLLEPKPHSVLQEVGQTQKHKGGKSMWDKVRDKIQNPETQDQTPSKTPPREKLQKAAFKATRIRRGNDTTLH